MSMGHKIKITIIIKIYLTSQLVIDDNCMNQLTEDQHKMVPLLIEAAMPCGSVMLGPAPNSGDGIPDGPSRCIEVPHPSLHNEGPGPLLNAGDGIPDGSGF